MIGLRAKGFGRACSWGDSRRQGYTLIELLVVIGIILIVVALAWGATMRVVAQQSRTNTELTLKKVSSALQRQWKAATDEALAVPVSKYPPALRTQAQTDPDGARDAFVRLYLKREFPTSFSEAMNPGQGLLPRQIYVNAINTCSASYTPEQQTGVLLYLSLKITRRGETCDPDVILAAQELCDRYGTGMKEIVDGWGTPLAFYRENTGEIKYMKPQVPGKYILDPVVVSAGENTLLGLDSLMREVNPYDSNDNLYSFLFHAPVSQSTQVPSSTSSSSNSVAQTSTSSSSSQTKPTSTSTTSTSTKPTTTTTTKPTTTTTTAKPTTSTTTTPTTTTPATTSTASTTKPASTSSGDSSTSVVTNSQAATRVSSSSISTSSSSISTSTPSTQPATTPTPTPTSSPTTIPSSTYPPTGSSSGSPVLE